jgi:hypothetical protein
LRLFSASSELESHSQVCCKLEGDKSVVLYPPTNRSSRRSALTEAVRVSSVTEKQVFAFDYVYGDDPDHPERNTQAHVFSDLGSIVLDNAFAGFNCSLLAYGQTGAGKCFAEDTPLLMADGSRRMVQHIQASDALLGDDGAPRTVLPGSLVRGKARLRQIVTDEHHTERLVVNSEHILVLAVPEGPSPVAQSADGSFQFSCWTINKHNTLQREQRSFTSFDAASSARDSWQPLLWEVSVRVFLNEDGLPLEHPQHVCQEARDACRMYQPAAPISFPLEQQGALREAITAATSLQPSEQLLHETAWAIGAWIAATPATPAPAACPFEPSAFHHILSFLSLDSSRHLLSPTDQQPSALLRDAPSIRQHLLAGCLSACEEEEATWPTEHLADLTYLARSLGLRVQTVQSELPVERTPCTLSGTAMDSHPLSQFKQARFTKTSSLAADPSHCFAFTLVDWCPPHSSSPLQPYYGFAVDGNQRFLTADFLVTHNSHSMMGYKPEDTIQHATADADTTGFIPRLCSALFAKISSNTNANLTHTIEVSYLEIYSEKIHDLLNAKQSREKENLQVRQHPKKGPYVEGLTIVPVKSYSQLEGFMQAGNAERTVGATNLNERSSRSHAVFTIIFTATHTDKEVKLSSDVVSKIQLVDLSGSERAEFSGATGTRLKEASQINKSLSTLGRVVSALALKSQAERASSHASPSKRQSVSEDVSDPHFVPFRDSVLTWLLKESLGGNAKTLMIACVSVQKHAMRFCESHSLANS